MNKFQFGCLIVLKVFHVNNRTLAKVRCSCGQVKDVRLDSLKRGATRSCGCLQRQVLYSSCLMNVVVMLKNLQNI